MFHSAKLIADLVQKGDIVITPFSRELLKPASYTLRFSDSWRIWAKSKTPIEAWRHNAAIDHLGKPVIAEDFTLAPGGCALGSTIERLAIPENLLAFAMPLSHWARFGILMNLGAALVSPNFGAEEPKALTIEIVNLNPSPIRIRSGVPACHLAFAVLHGDSDLVRLSLGRSVYGNQAVPCEPLLYEEFAKILTTLNE